MRANDDPTRRVHVPMLRPAVEDHGWAMEDLVTLEPVMRELERLRRQRSDEEPTRPLRLTEK